MFGSAPCGDNCRSPHVATTTRASLWEHDEIALPEGVPNAPANITSSIANATFSDVVLPPASFVLDTVTPGNDGAFMRVHMRVSHPGYVTAYPVFYFRNDPYLNWVSAAFDSLFALACVRACVRVCVCACVRVCVCACVRVCVKS